MNTMHDNLCPRQLGWWRKCRCDLILEVRSDQRIRDRIPNDPDSALIYRKWYWSGRQDAAEEIEGMMHKGTCMCDYCSVLVSAQHAAHGNYSHKNIGEKK